MQTQQTQNSFRGPKSYRDFGETGPSARNPESMEWDPESKTVLYCLTWGEMLLKRLPVIIFQVILSLYSGESGQRYLNSWMQHWLIVEHDCY